MLDTVKVKSPELPSEILDRIAERLQTRYTVDNTSKEILTEFTSGVLLGSYDHRTRVEVCRKEVKAIPASLTASGKPVQYFENCSHIIIEGSVHKAMLGFNIFGGPEDPRAAVRWYVAHIAERLGVDLPDGDLWTLMRLDVSECFNLETFEACAEYISTLRLARFPRRQCNSWGDETVSFNGTTTGWKIYHKGPEFAEHDRRRLLNYLTYDQVSMLQEMANGILRVETSIKLKKLKNDFGGNALVRRCTTDYTSAVYDTETLKVLRESEQDMTNVRKNRDVRVRLFEQYGDRLGGILYGTWLSFCACGEDEARKNMSRPTFYRRRKQLQDAGVSWFGSDVVVTASAIPEGFSLRRSDPRRIVGEADVVKACLSPFMTVAA